MRRITMLFTVAAMMALIMAVSAGPASADDWDHGSNRWDQNELWDNNGCWEWSRVFEEWQYECDDGFWWDRDHKDFNIFVKDFDRRDKKFDRHDKNRHKNDGRNWDWRD
jgi:hypothetical protein